GAHLFIPLLPLRLTRTYPVSHPAKITRISHVGGDVRVTDGGNHSGQRAPTAGWRPRKTFPGRVGVRRTARAGLPRSAFSLVGRLAIVGSSRSRGPPATPAVRSRCGRVLSLRAPPARSAWAVAALGPAPAAA